MIWSRKKEERTEHGYVAERLSAYLDGELSPQEQGVVERHLAECQDCRWDLETLRQTVQWLGELPTVSVPRVFTIPVPAQPVRAPRFRWGMPLLQGATALVALLLVIVVAGDYLLTGFPLAGVSQSQVGGERAPAEVVVETLVVEVTREVEGVVKEMVTLEMPEAEKAMPASTESAVLEAPAPGGEGLVTEVALPAEAPPPAEAAPVEEEMRVQAEVTFTPTPDNQGSGMTALGTPAGDEALTVEAPGEPTPTATATATSEPTPTMSPTVVPTEPPATAAPTVVAEAQEAPLTSRAEQQPVAVEERPESLILWLGVTEIVLMVALVLLAATTMVVMIRRRRMP